MDTLLAVYGAPWQWLSQAEPWLTMLIISLILTAKLSFGGWVLAKSGRSPLWILLLLLPWVEVPGLWIFAYGPWPGMPASGTGGTTSRDTEAQSPP